MTFLQGTGHPCWLMRLVLTAWGDPACMLLEERMVKLSPYVCSVVLGLAADLLGMRFDDPAFWPS